MRNRHQRNLPSAYLRAIGELRSCRECVEVHAQMRKGFPRVQTPHVGEQRHMPRVKGGTQARAAAVGEAVQMFVEVAREKAVLGHARKSWRTSAELRAGVCFVFIHRLRASLVRVVESKLTPMSYSVAKDRNPRYLVIYAFSITHVFSTQICLFSPKMQHARILEFWSKWCCPKSFKIMKKYTRFASNLESDFRTIDQITGIPILGHAVYATSSIFC